MYYTNFHKAIFNDIWRGGDLKSKKGKAGNSYDFEKYLDFCYKHKNGVVFEKVKQNNELNFSSRPLKKDIGYIINKSYETRMILMLNEYVSLIDYLHNNDLILVVDKMIDCPPLFLESGLPFDDALKVIKPYVGKELVVREGFKKFKRFNYCTHEELVRIILALLVPAVTIIVFVVKALFDYFFNKF